MKRLTPASLDLSGAVPRGGDGPLPSAGPHDGQGTAGPPRAAVRAVRRVPQGGAGSPAGAGGRCRRGRAGRRAGVPHVAKAGDGGGGGRKRRIVRRRLVARRRHPFGMLLRGAETPNSPQIPVSCLSSRQTQCWTRNMVVKGGSQRQITLLGVDSTTDKQITALSTPMNVFWRCEPRFTLVSQGAINADLG